MSNLILRIQGNSIADEECWIWQGAIQQCGTVPMIRYNGASTGVRRAILLERGVTLGKWQATYTCSNPLCVNPEHVVARPRSSIQKRAYAAQSKSDIVARNKKIADGLRASSHRIRLSIEIAREIRAAEGTNVVIAQKYGIDPSDVSAIKLRKVWKEYTRNPMTGELM